MSNYSNYFGARRCCNSINNNVVQGPQGPQGLGGPIGPAGYTGPTGSQGPRGYTGCRGSQGATGSQGPRGSGAGETGPTGPQGATGPGFTVIGEFGITGSTAAVLLSYPEDSNDIYYSSAIQQYNTSDRSILYISGNIIPTKTNTYSLGLTSATWKDIAVGPGTLTIQGPTGYTIAATLGSNLTGLAYTQYGFATPFINIGPAIDPLAPVGTIGG
jgi:hypothetical protein